MSNTFCFLYVSFTWPFIGKIYVQPCSPVVRSTFSKGPEKEVKAAKQHQPSQRRKNKPISPDFKPPICKLSKQITTIRSFRGKSSEMCQGLPNISFWAFESRVIRSKKWLQWPLKGAWNHRTKALSRTLIYFFALFSLYVSIKTVLSGHQYVSWWSGPHWHCHVHPVYARNSWHSSSNQQRSLFVSDKTLVVWSSRDHITCC